METCDVVIWDTVCGPFGEHLAQTESLGGAEYALVRMARELARLGYSVLCFGNRTDEEASAPPERWGAPHSERNGFVRYLPNSKVPPIACKALIHVRYSGPAPVQIKAERRVVFAVDSGHPANTKPWDWDKFVCLSEWHASMFRSQPGYHDIIWLPGMLDDSIYDLRKTPKNPTKFVYVSAAMKGLKETLEAWDRLWSRMPPRTVLEIATPAWSKPTEEMIRDYSARSVKFHDPLPTSDVPRFIADASGMFYVNVFPETFCNLAAIAEAVGTRVHILCKNGLGGLKDAVNSPWVTESEADFEAGILATYGKDGSVVTPKNLRASKLIGDWVKLLHLPAPGGSAMRAALTSDWSAKKPDMTMAPRIQARAVELANAYAEFKVPHTFWARHAPTISAEKFRGHDQFLWQGHEYPYAMICRYLVEESGLGGDILRRLGKEDGAFGCVARAWPYPIPGPSGESADGEGPDVSRDLLDSAIEIEFLSKHLFPSHANVLDIGAGYGRFAHRMATYYPSCNVYCVDAVPIATAVCEEYIRYRNLPNVHVVPLHELHRIPEHIDLAVNIHSWSECTRQGVQFWLEFLKERNIKKLFLVPHDENFAANEDGWPSFRPLLDSYGFKVSQHQKLTFGRPDWSGQFYHYLFEQGSVAAVDHFVKAGKAIVDAAVVKVAEGDWKTPPLYRAEEQIQASFAAAGDLSELAKQIVEAPDGSPMRKRLIDVERRSRSFGNGMGTHLPVLASAVAIAGPGDVLELGGGDMSTPLLSEMCAAMGRRLVTVEPDERWQESFGPHHIIVKSPSDIDTLATLRADERWAVIFIDQSEPERRAMSVRTMADAAEIVVLHDSTCAYYAKASAELHTLPFVYEYANMIPATAIASKTRPVGGAKPKPNGVAHAKKEEPMRSTVCLTMIVKAGSEHLERALKSAKPLVTSYVVVLDDESTDDTVARIHKAMQGMQGKILHRPWKDFSSNRNAAIELAKDRAEYVLVLDADDELEGVIPRQLTADCYEIKVDDVRLSYWRRHIFKPTSGLHYEGVRHETLCESGPIVCERLESLTYKRRGAGTTPEGYLKDAQALAEALADNPSDGRSAFYLAQSLADGGMTEEAIAAYEHRASMGGWDEEVFYALYQVGNLKVKLGRPIDEITAAYARAIAKRPGRAEPYYQIARVANERQQWGLAYEFAKGAVSQPFPAVDRLFVDEEVYRWRALWELAVSASWLGKKPEARTLFENLKLITPAEQHPIIDSNLQFC